MNTPIATLATTSVATDLAKERIALRASLRECLDLLIDKFPWAEGPPYCTGDPDAICSDCQSNGCIADKVRRAHKALHD